MLVSLTEVADGPSVMTGAWVSGTVNVVRLVRPLSTSLPSGSAGRTRRKNVVDGVSPVILTEWLWRNLPSGLGMMVPSCGVSPYSSVLVAGSSVVHWTIADVW